MPEHEPQSQGPNFLEDSPQGVKALLTLNSRTRAVHRFFGNLPSGYGDPINPDNLHVMLMYPIESEVDVFSNRVIIALRRTTHEVTSYLSKMAVTREVLHPDGAELKKFGRRLAIPLRHSGIIEELRGSIGEIVEDELGVRLRGDYEAHASVVHAPKGRSRAKEYVPPFPRNLHVKGFLAGIERTGMHNPGRSRSAQPYDNQPPVKRGKKSNSP